MCGIFLTDEPHTRKPRIARDRDSALAFVQTFSDDVFKNHFRVTRETFNEIVSRMITVYPGKQGSGILNYERALLRGKCSTPGSGATTLELKLCVTLRLLAGASHCDMIWFGVQTGSVHNTAYQQTNLYRMFTKAMIPTKYHMVLDEAYGGIGGEFHLTPFTRSQLRKARRESVTKYKKMKSFNHFLSSQRITIERCFGMFVRKFGILWKTLDYSLSTNTLILQVCAKLHNLCINHWMKAGDRATEIQKIDNDFRLQNDARIFTNTTSGRFEQTRILNIDTIPFNHKSTFNFLL